MDIKKEKTGFLTRSVHAGNDINLDNGDGDTETIYIFLDEKPDINTLNVINLDGYTVGIYSN